jgi:uncharacterized protein (TIGR00299 family) protein
VIGFLDCYSGLSGDMLLGALVDAGFPTRGLEQVVGALGLHAEVGVRAEEVDRGGLRAMRIHVEPRCPPVPRGFDDAVRILAVSSLPDPVRATAIRVLRRLAAAESEVHGTAAVPDHDGGEVPVDTLVDVAGTVAGLVELEVDELWCSALPAAPADISGAKHGPLPGPGPATLALLAGAGAPLRPFGAGQELVTPTGAALAVSLARFEQPAMRLQRVGCGAGAAPAPWPNLLRLWLGTKLEGTPRAVEGRVVMETSIDDMSPELLAPIARLLLEAGALDVHSTPLLMKKGRPGVLVTVIARDIDEARLAHLMLRETTTLGVRVHDVRRYEAERRITEVMTPFGAVSVKLKLLDGAVVGAMPEFESVSSAATAAGASLAAVHAAASAAAQGLLETPSRV